MIEHFWPSYLACGLRRHEAVELNFGHIQRREEHWAIVDMKGKAGHTRTIPMPGWVKDVVDHWIQAANITSGKLFRRVHKMGKTWGERLTERRSGTWFGSTPRRLESTSYRRTISAEPVHGFATPPEANWSKSNFCSVTFRFRQRNDISVANSGFKMP